MTEFRPREILGYHPKTARNGRDGGGFKLGRFSLSGCQRRVIARDLRGTCFRAVARDYPLRMLRGGTRRKSDWNGL